MAESKKREVGKLKNFVVTAEVSEKTGKKKFSVSVKAHSANYAAEKALCIIGSKHRKSRRKVALKEVREADEKKGGKNNV